MKPRMLVLMSTITLIAVLAVPIRPAAQETQQAEDASNVGTSTSYPVPLINQPLVPDAAKPGGAAFTLTVNGTGFVSGAVVKWNGSARTTTFVSSSQLKASIPASDIAKASTASVTVVNPTPGGGTSNVVFFEVTLSSSSIALGPPRAFWAGSGPAAVTVGDFNNDGKPDLAVTNARGNNVGILLNNGNGTFRSAVDYNTGSIPQDLATGDFQGNGRADLAVPNESSNDVSILLGNGDGTFQAAVNYGAGSSPNAVGVGDFNGDGKLDLAVSNAGSNDVSVLLGNGDGTFQAAMSYATGGPAFGIPAVGDFNGDGKLDLAVANVPNAGGLLSILLGNGDGTFQPPVNYTVGSAPHGVVAADFNGDGKLDFAVANDTSNDVSILLGNGDGTFRPAVNYGAGSSPNSVSVGDFNGDGKLDLVVADNFTNTVSVLLGNGDGTFQPAVQYVAAGGNANYAAVGDFNGDGRLDVAVADYNSGNGTVVSVLLQAPIVSLSKTSLTFADQVVGSSSPLQTVTLSNPSGLTLNISSIAVTGTDPNDFSQTNTCGSSVAPQRSCTITVTFKPTQVGPRTASVTITDNAADSPQQIALSGTGVVSGPNGTFSPTSLTFATQLVGTTSPAQSITLTDYGTAALSISSITIKGADAGDFAQTSNCGSSVAPEASCTINVTFRPTQRGSRTAALSVADNAPGSPQTASLSGTGTVVKFNPTSLGFGAVQVGQTSHEATTLTNVGSTTLSINSITITGTDSNEFSQTNNCGSSAGAGKSCTITVGFRPTERGFDSASVSVSDNGGGSPQQVPLSGSGCVIVKKRCITAPSSSPAVQSALAANRTAAVPGPTGPSPVGTRVMDFVDSTRDDPYLADGTKRELLLRFWYPASLSQGCNRARYNPPQAWKNVSELLGTPVPEVRTNSCQDAPITEGTHPLVLFTHGYTGTFTDYTFLFEDLASRGYVVASVDHTYEATAVEFPDGRFAKSVLGSHWNDTWRTDEQTLSFAVSVRLGDLRFVVNELERLNAESGSPFAGKLDTARLAIAGHSLGGMTALPAVLQDARFKAGVLIDGWPDSLTMPTQTPVLILAAGHERWSEGERGLWNNLRGPRLAVNLRGAEHVTPSDLVWLAKGAVKTGSMGPDKTIAAMRSYIAAFLDANLRGQPMSPLLKGPSSEYPDAVVTTEKQSLRGEAVNHSAP